LKINVATEPLILRSDSRKTNEGKAKGVCICFNRSALAITLQNQEALPVRLGGFLVPFCRLCSPKLCDGEVQKGTKKLFAGEDALFNRA